MTKIRFDTLFSFILRRTGDPLYHGLLTPNEVFFSSKSLTFGLGQTIRADKFWGIWGIFGRFIKHYFYKKLSLYIFIWDWDLNFGHKELGIQPSCLQSVLFIFCFFCELGIAISCCNRAAIFRPHFLDRYELMSRNCPTKYLDRQQREIFPTLFVVMSFMLHTVQHDKKINLLNFRNLFSFCSGSFFLSAESVKSLQLSISGVYFKLGKSC